MKLYLAAPYRRKDEIKKCAVELAGFNIQVTSSWLEETHEANVQMHDLTPEEHRHYAVRDVDDVVIADGLVLFTDPTQSIVRQGRTAEMGMAVIINRLIRPMPIFVVGNLYENIFHHMPGVYHFATWEEVRDVLVSIHNNGNTLANWALCKTLDTMR